MLVEARHALECEVVQQRVQHVWAVGSLRVGWCLQILYSFKRLSRQCINTLHSFATYWAWEGLDCASLMWPQHYLLPGCCFASEGASGSVAP